MATDLRGRATPLEAIPSQPPGLCPCGCGGRPKKTWVWGHHRRPLGPLAEERDCGYETPCWVWLSWRFVTGYGGIALDGDQQLAHRWVYEAMVGPIPADMTIDHLCFNRPCVNPVHLEPVTVAENSERQWAAGRGKLTPLATVNAAKTHCPHGHEYSAANTLVSRGKRYCRTCARERARRVRARKS